MLGVTKRGYICSSDTVKLQKYRQNIYVEPPIS